MPGPAGTYQAYQVQHLPANPQLLRGASGPIIEKPQHYQFGKQIATGAAAGASSGGWIGSAIGAGVGLVGDIISWRVNKKAQKEAQEFNKEQADKAYGRELAASREAAHWNSEGSQLERLKAAGLSPALAYQGLGPSTMQAASASPASSPAPPVADFGADGLGAYNAAIQSRAVDATAQLQASEGAKMDVERLQIEIDNLTRHQSNIAAYEQLLSQKGLNEVSADKIRQLLELEKSQLSETISNIQASTQKINTESTFISGVQSNLVKSQTNLVNAQIKTEGERPYEIRQNIETSGDLAAYYRRQSSLLAQEFGIKQSKVDAIASYLDDNGYSRDYLGFALNFCEDMSQHVGSDLSKQSISTIFSWLNGDSWLRYIGSRQNTRDINLNRSNIAEYQTQSNERIAAGHDAARLESIDSYFEHTARSHDAEIRKEFNKYRSEYHLLNKANKKRIDELSAYYESKGYDTDRIAQELGYLTHQLYLSQNVK